MILMRELLMNAVQEGHLRNIDLHFAIMVAHDDPAVMLAAALLSNDTSKGHTCLPLSHLLTDITTPTSIKNCFAAIGTSLDWYNTLLHSPAISEGKKATPLILSNKRLYLNRHWHDEQTVANFFSNENQLLDYNREILKQTLNILFDVDKEEINWQKVAVAIALTRRISVISGGPGTGKTTTVAKLLAAIVQLPGNEKCRIQLAAPTGKAATRLTKSIYSIIKQLDLHKSQLKLLPKKACTLHNLLGAQQGYQRMRYHADNQLHLDLLVVDETSMVDLAMMSKLIQALPSHARIIYLGDHNQLASVEAGSVLRDICSYSNNAYTASRALELAEITGYNALKRYTDSNVNKLQDNICLLQKNYRFNNNSGINQLAIAVNNGNYHIAQKLFTLNFRDIKKKLLYNNKTYLAMLKEVMEGYRSFLVQVQQRVSPDAIIAEFNKYQLLCALHKGSFGVTGLNENLEHMLARKHKIRKFMYSKWYEGRPIIILRNSNTLGLVRGDVGVTLNQKEEGLRVWFQLSNDSIKSVHPSRLPEHETAWAMTVHKSQGLEFEQVALILPLQMAPIVTRELLYTAITRARHQLSVYTNDTILEQAITASVKRRSGLSKILNKS